MNLTDCTATTRPVVLKNGMNEFSVTVSENKVDFRIEKSDIIKKNLSKLLLFFLFLLLGVILLVFSAII